MARIMRRINSSRAAVYLEFALIAPLVLTVVLFAADFCRILLAQQHLEIAARCMADIESHYYQVSKDKDFQSATETGTETPHKSTKRIVGNYVCEGLGETEKTKSGYYTSTMCQAEVQYVPGILTTISQYTFDKLEGSPADGWGLKILKFVIKGALEMITGGTHKYFEQLLGCDRMLGATCAVRLKTLFPVQAYAFFTQFKYKGYLYVAMTHYGNEVGHGAIDYSQREKHFCYMPVMDTCAVPPSSWIRKAETHLKKSAFMGFLRKIGVAPEDAFKR